MEDPKPGRYGASIRGIKILVVDDDAQARAGLVELLEGCGAVVSSVGSAALARAAMADWAPDLLISDLEMPVESGLVLVARLRASGVTIPAIAVTGYDHPGRRVEALMAGYDIFLRKPVPPARIVLTIFHLMRGNPAASSEKSEPRPKRSRPSKDSDPTDVDHRKPTPRQSGPDALHLSPRRRNNTRRS